MTTKPILWDLPMPIRTPRLTIMPAAAGMGQGMYDAVMETQPQLREWFGWAHKDPTPDGYEEIMREEGAKFAMRKDFMLLAFDKNNKMIGSTGFHPINQFETPVVHIGYWCRQSEQGKGYVTEIVNGLTRYAFDVMNLKKVSIHIAQENAASIAVAERTGFPLEYTSRFGALRPHTNELTTLNVYSRFDTNGLPPLDVSWGL